MALEGEVKNRMFGFSCVLGFRGCLFSVNDGLVLAESRLLSCSDDFNTSGD